MLAVNVAVGKSGVWLAVASLVAVSISVALAVDEGVAVALGVILEVAVGVLLAVGVAVGVTRVMPSSCATNTAPATRMMLATATSATRKGDGKLLKGLCGVG
jgi:hypothetical protein